MQARLLFPLKPVSGSDLQKIRSHYGWTQQDVARTLQMGQPNVSHWEAGTWSPRHAYHLAVRYLIASQNPEKAFVAKKEKSGRPLSNKLLVAAKCPHPRCLRGDRQMHKSREAYDHPMLGSVLSVDCTGNGTHPRVTRRIDRRGWLWDVRGWPCRKKLAPFEMRRVRDALDLMDAPAKPHELLACLQKCGTALDGTPGCGKFLRYEGQPASTNASTKKLHVFMCAHSCGLQWKRRYFTASGEEMPVESAGGARAGSKVKGVSVPPGARLCPVCEAKLNSPKECSIVGGEAYSPPLIRLVCPNPRGIDHTAPGRSRRGLTFYYDRKRSRFVEVYSRARTRRGPLFTRNCKIHGRMNRSTIPTIKRLPAAAARNAIEASDEPPFYRDYCPCTEVFLTQDGRILIRRENPRKNSTPFRNVMPGVAGESEGNTQPSA